MNLAKKTRQKIFRNKHLLISLLLAIALIGAIAMPAHAQRDILTTTSKNISQAIVDWGL